MKHTIPLPGPKSAQKMGLGVEIRKTNVEITISILEIPYVPIFRENRQLRIFRPKFAQKWI